MTTGRSPSQKSRRPRASGTARGREEPTQSTAVHVNNRSKVSDLDPERYEEVPTGGGRFSAWRRRMQVMGPGEGFRAGAQYSSPSTETFHRGLSVRKLMGFSALGLLLIVLLVWVLFYSPLLAVRSIEVNGAHLTDSQEVRGHLESFHGVPMTTISERDVMDRLGDLPQVRSVQVMTMPDNRLVVDLTERVPVAVVRDGDQWAVVDQEATVLQVVDDRGQAHVPLIEGGREALSSEQFKVVSGVLSTLPSSLLEQVDSAKAVSSSTVELQLHGGITVRWGDSTQGALKADVLAQLVESREQTGAVNVYDVSSPEHPVLE
ncbi:MAG: cell division protein FtsQ/DivIB [Kocuria sp.]|nr:cell division protein FtsQ/DivIB [Kocuria sp.]